MATTIGKLAAILSLNSAQFDQGLDQSAGKLDDFNKSAGKTSRKIKDVGDTADGSSTGLQKMAKGLGKIKRLALGAGAAMTALLAGVSASVVTGTQAINEQARAAQKLGIPIEKLAGLKLAAETTGADLDALQDAMTELAVRASEARFDPEGDAGEAFKLMRLDAEALTRLRPDEQLLAVAEALSKIENRNLRLQIIDQAIGGEATELIRLFDLGADGLERMNREAAKLGTVVTQADVRKAQLLTEQFEFAKSALTGINQQVTTNAAGTAAAGVGATTDALITGRSFLAEDDPRLSHLSRKQQANVRRFAAIRAGQRNPFLAQAGVMPDAPTGDFQQQATDEMRLIQREQLRVMWAQHRAQVNQQANGSGANY